MSISSRLIEWVFRLAPAKTRHIVIERDIKIPMRDGVALLADRYYPRGKGKLPTLLVRSCYGKTGFIGFLNGRLYAERGFQVLIQNCRGTFGSGGELNPFHQEREDGLATIEWIREQKWFSGDLGMVGASYLGYVQWAIGGDAEPELKAMSIQVTTSEFRGPTYVGESFAIHDPLIWVYGMSKQEKMRLGMMAAMIMGEKKIRSVANALPLNTLDKRATGEKVSYWQDWLAHSEPEYAWWKPSDHSERVFQVSAPVRFVGGWYDIFLPGMIKDYTALHKAGRAPYLTIGPWHHLSPGVMSYGLRDSIDWFWVHLLGDKRRLPKKPVKIFIMGLKEWRHYEEWPPRDARAEYWYLQAGSSLTTDLPKQAEPSCYRYDPADPTPNVGGAIMGRGGGAKDNRTLEARSDVLVFTSEPMHQNLEVIGPVRAELYVRSSQEHTDFFVRLCDRYPSGKSINICDGIRRLRPGGAKRDPEGCLGIKIEMWPTSHCFRRGHRIRVQISSGAHPRYARNTGSGEPIGEATRFCIAEQAVFHDPSHPSAVILPTHNPIVA
jgi:putative CocE/NonD family hydrolase